MMIQGLSTSKVQDLLKQYGYNEIPEKSASISQKIIKNLISPISLMLLTASGLSFWLHKYFDAHFILILLLINITITLWQEHKADQAIKKLNNRLQQKLKVLRDNHWVEIPTRELVPGDTIQLDSGEIIPADGKVIEAHHVSINESALTGESLPKDKKVGDQVFSGSFVSSGIVTIEITATGIHTSFGKTILSVERVHKKSLLEQDILNTSRFLTTMSLIAVFILSVFLIINHAPLLELLTLNLSLVIAGIPISLPTVMTLIIEFGVLALAKKKVIVRRLSALEDLANVNFLLTDKTGTLTQNRITIHDHRCYNHFQQQDLLKYAAIIASCESDNPIDTAIITTAQHQNISLPKFDKVDFIPADSTRKRSTLHLKLDGPEQIITIGAPQVITTLTNTSKATLKQFNQDVAAFAKRGDRTLALAVGYTHQEKRLQLVGLLAMSDTLRTDAKSTVSFLKRNGVDVAIVTGDNQAIASQITAELDLEGDHVITKKMLDKKGVSSLDAKLFNQTGAFAEVLPEDKFHLVEQAKKYFIVASNGDGINDLPAVKAANVGIAVHNAVPALKATADIVLLNDGIKVIRDSIIESRKIFQRIYTYSLYRISESLRLIITIAILGILYKSYPLTALQIVMIALLNDIPIISLAFDRVKVANKPNKLDAKARFLQSSLYGLVGVVNSLLLFFLVKNVWHFDWAIIQTMYFLKLTVSGHLLIYVAHTKERWWKFLPSGSVIWATFLTQVIATILALTGFMMPGKLNLTQIIFVWIWAIIFMQITEAVKWLKKH